MNCKLKKKNNQHVFHQFGELYILFTAHRDWRTGL
jgi:hypothetical protein